MITAIEINGKRFVPKESADTDCINCALQEYCRENSSFPVFCDTILSGKEIWIKVSDEVR